MRRLNLANLLDRIEAEGANGEGLTRRLTWRNALLMAHVETRDGPDLQMIREDWAVRSTTLAGHRDLDRPRRWRCQRTNWIISLRTAGVRARR